MIIGASGTVNVTNGTFRADTITSYTSGVDLTLSGQGSGIVDINDNLSVQNSLLVDTITELTTDAGVNIEDVTIEDGTLTR